MPQTLHIVSTQRPAIFLSTQDAATLLGFSVGYITHLCHRYRARIEALGASQRAVADDEWQPRYNELRCAWMPAGPVGTRYRVLATDLKRWQQRRAAQGTKEPRPDAPAGYVPIAQAARVLGITRGLLYYHIDQGRLASVRVDKYRFVRQDDLVALARENPSYGAPEPA